jgi:hypothetical protein
VYGLFVLQSRGYLKKCPCKAPGDQVRSKNCISEPYPQELDRDIYLKPPVGLLENGGDGFRDYASVGTGYLGDICVLSVMTQTYEGGECHITMI